MRYALVSDIHANLQAWTAVLEDMQTLGIDQIINLGDVVGYGPNPSEVLESVRAQSQLSVIGNHDAVCADRMCASIFNDQARAAIEWTQAQLDSEACKFLENLPDIVRPKSEDFLITHAEVVAPLDFGYILTTEDAEKNFAACEDSIIFIGHTHKPGLFLQKPSGEVTIHEPGEFTCDDNFRYIINPGSVGDPRSEDIVASYCIFDSDTRDVEFRRVEFDIDAYREAIDTCGLEARPFFLRYLDAVAQDHGGNVPLLPAMDHYMPQFDVSVQIPVVKGKKKMSPFLPIGIVSLLIGAACIAWIMFPRSNSDATESTTTTLNEKPTTIPAPSTQVAPTPPEIKTTFPFNARYIRISKPKGGTLSLAEVKVIKDKINLALRKPASQSSNYDNKTMLAGKAVDGIDRGDLDNHFTHTKHQPPTKPTWWEVDLGEEFDIQAVVILNRNQGRTPKGKKVLMKRLDGFTLEAFNDKRQTVYRTRNHRGAVHKIVLK